MKKDNFVTLIPLLAFFLIFIKVVFIDSSISNSPIPIEYINKKKVRYSFFGYCERNS